MNKKVFLQPFEWPLLALSESNGFRDCDTFRGHDAGVPGAGRGTSAGVGTWKVE